MAGGNTTPRTVPFSQDFADAAQLAHLSPTRSKRKFWVPLYTLPATYQDKNYQVFKTEQQQLEAFLKQEFDLKRLNDIHWPLRIAGRKMAARPLHRQSMMGRTIVPTEQIDLHLVWSDAGILIKPFPAYLLHHDFWKTNICSNSDVYESAKGFVLSYAWLISREVDFQMAQSLDNGMTLLPPGLKWPCWVAFLKSFLATVDVKNLPGQNINKRYQYGELRLGRLNFIYRITCRGVLRGYHFGFNTYDSFFRRNFAWLIVVFAYVTIILTAMQVGLATQYKDFKNNGALNRISYGFAVFSMVLPAAAVGFMLFLFGILLISNLIATIVNNISARNARKNVTQHQTGHP